MDKAKLMQEALELVNWHISGLSTGGMRIVGRKAYSHYVSEIEREKKAQFVLGYIDACAGMGIFDAVICSELHEKIKEQLFSRKLEEESMYAAAVNTAIGRIDIETAAEEITNEFKENLKKARDGIR